MLDTSKCTKLKAKNGSSRITVSVSVPQVIIVNKGKNMPKTDNERVRILFRTTTTSTIALPNLAITTTDPPNVAITTNDGSISENIEDQSDENSEYFNEHSNESDNDDDDIKDNDSVVGESEAQRLNGLLEFTLHRFNIWLKFI